VHVSLARPGQRHDISLVCVEGKPAVEDAASSVPLFLYCTSTQSRTHKRLSILAEAFASISKI
jgi:hypothetical protein